MIVASAIAEGLPADGSVGRDIYALAARIYPINRSITGHGVRETLRALSQGLPLTLHEVPSGTPMLDWTVPPEWNIREAYIADATGNRIIDFKTSNLHIVGYSEPVRRRMTFAELRPHLHTLPDQPDLIPYRTSYYTRTWGFCLTHRQFEALGDGPYDVMIDSTLDEAGSLTYGEILLPGATTDEVLLSAHVCHPSLANDNCSGLALLAWLARHLATRQRRLSYRILFAPGTIGAISWLARNRDATDRIKHGLILANLGDGGGPTYKKSRRGTALVDRAAAHVLALSGKRARVDEFTPYGYDERQFGSPGFDLPVGSLQRSRWGEFPEYHTSADNLDFIRPEHLDQSLRVVLEILDVIELDRRVTSLMPYGEPQLGRRGLYDSADGRPLPESVRMAYLWVLNQADGTQTLLDIAERAKLPFNAIREAADRLQAAGLIAEV